LSKGQSFSSNLDLLLLRTFGELTLLQVSRFTIVYPANLRSNKIRWAATLVGPHYLHCKTGT